MTPVRLNPHIHPSWNVKNFLWDQLVNTTTKAKDLIEHGKLKDLEVSRSRNITLIKKWKYFQIHNFITRHDIKVYIF